MTEHSRYRPDRSGGPRRSPDAFDELVAQPGLAGLAGRGSRLDRLPVRSTTGALLASLFVSQLMFGVAGAVLVVVMAALPLILAAALVRDGEVHAGRMMLRLVSGVLLAWMAIAVLLVPPPSSPGPPRTSDRPPTYSAPPTSSAGPLTVR